MNNYSCCWHSAARVLCIFISEPKDLPVKWQQYTKGFKKLQDLLFRSIFLYVYWFYLTTFLPNAIRICSSCLSQRGPVWLFIICIEQSFGSLFSATNIQVFSLEAAGTRKYAFTFRCDQFVFQKKSLKPRELVAMKTETATALVSARKWNLHFTDFRGLSGRETTKLWRNQDWVVTE